MKNVLVAICLLLPVVLAAQGNVFDPRSMEYRGYVFEKYEPPYEVGRAMLPGLLCFIGGAMPDTKRGRAVQHALFFTAGVSVGAWKGTNRKQKWIYAGCAVAGAVAGFIVRNNTI